MKYRLIFSSTAIQRVILFYRKKQKLIEKLMLDDMVASQNIENYEHETKSVISNLKQDLTPSDRESLSRATTPEALPIANDNEKKEEITSLVKVKDFEDYVKQAIQSGLLDKQYEVSFDLVLILELLNCLLNLTFTRRTKS